MMEVECSKLDRISTFPQDIIRYILTLMPLGDALKTSILSRKWRYKWASISKLYIDCKILPCIVSDRVTLTNAIFHVLLLHTSPLLEFTWLIYLTMPSEIDQIILYLSRNNTLQRLTLANSSVYHYKLPSSFFSFQKLEFLVLQKCVFKPPLTFNGFSTLRCLTFYDNVEITTKSLKHFLTNCPLLEEFHLLGKKENGENRSFVQEDKLTFVELFKSSPAIEELSIKKYYLEHFDTLYMPRKLPISLVHLKTLYLGVYFMEKDDLLCVLCLIKSSPNLTNFYLQNEKPHDSQSITMASFDLQDHSNFKLDHLDKYQMKNFSNLTIEMDILKLIVAHSPLLKNVRIKLNENFPVDEELKIFKDTFPRASPFVKFVVERPKTFCRKYSYYLKSVT